MYASMNLTPAGQELFLPVLSDKLGDFALDVMDKRRAGLWLPGMELPSGIDDILVAMAGFSNYLAEKILRHIFMTASYTKPSNIYISLHGADPTDANNTATELAIGTGGYARAVLAVTDASWGTPTVVGSVMQIGNASQVAFPIPSGVNWNAGLPIVWAGMYDAPTAGNLLASGALGTPRTVLIQDNAPVFGPGALVVSLA